MRQPGGGARFPKKTLADLGDPGQRIGQDLDGDGAIELDVESEVDDAHAAAPDLALQLEVRRQRTRARREVGDGVGHAPR
jgi:hypothetical protein